MLVFRVTFVGAEPDDVCDAVESMDATWELSEVDAGGAPRHWVLVGAASATDAARAVRTSLEGRRLAVGDVQAHPVTDRSGNLMSPPIRDEPDWTALDELALTSVHRELVMALLTGGEPTWILRRMEIGGEPSQIDRALEELEEHKLVFRTREVSGEPGRAREMDDWWAITDEGWDSLGLIRRPGYR